MTVQTAKQPYVCYGGTTDDKVGKPCPQCDEGKVMAVYEGMRTRYKCSAQCSDEIHYVDF